MLAVQAHTQGSVLPVRANPGSRRNELVDVHGGALRVAVTAPPEGGKANEAIVEVLADALNLRRTAISLIAGAGSRTKKFLIRGLEPIDLIARIEAALTPTMYDPQDPDV